MNVTAPSTPRNYFADAQKSISKLDALVKVGGPLPLVSFLLWDAGLDIQRGVEILDMKAMPSDERSALLALGKQLEGAGSATHGQGELITPTYAELLGGTWAPTADRIGSYAPLLNR